MHERREKPDGRSTGLPGKPRSGRETPVAPGPLSPGAALALQGTLGNRVVSRLLDDAPKRPPRPVQRKVAYKKDTDGTDEKAGEAFEACVKHLNDAVDWAHSYVISCPGLGALGKLDGHTEHWVEVWDEYVNAKRGALNKEFGYAVESLAAYRMQTTLNLPAGYSTGLQLPFGGTRPDVIVLGPGSALVAALDITASGSGGHIWKKDRWSDRFSRIAEITYPSLDGTTMTLMVSQKDATSPVSEAELAEVKKKAQEQEVKLAKRRAEIRDDFMKMLDGPLQEMKKTYSEMVKLVPKLPREAVMNWVRSGRFDVEHAEDLDKTVAGVLAALDIDGGQYGFGMSYVASVARGRSFLLASDKPKDPAWGTPVPIPDPFDSLPILDPSARRAKRKQDAISPEIAPEKKRGAGRDDAKKRAARREAAKKRADPPTKKRRRETTG